MLLEVYRHDSHLKKVSSSTEYMLSYAIAFDFVSLIKYNHSAPAVLIWNRHVRKGI